MTSLDGINGWSIQTLLRGENDSKQSDEFQARGKQILAKMTNLGRIHEMTNKATLPINEFSKKANFLTKMVNLIKADQMFGKNS